MNLMHVMAILIMKILIMLNNNPNNILLPGIADDFASTFLLASNNPSNSSLDLSFSN